MTQFQPQNGDRTTLSFDQRELLETKVLPTARRWLSMPGLAQQGVQTLDYWGERHGYTPKRMEKQNG